jgi:Receptor family ligand binding region
MALLSVLIIAAAWSLSIEDTVLVLSPNTPKGLSEELLDFNNRITINSKNPEVLIALLNAYDFKILIDITFQPSLFGILDTIASSTNSVYLSLSPTSDASYSRWRFNLHNWPFEESNAIFKLINYLDWNSFIMIGSTSENDLCIGNSLYSNFNSVTHSYIKYENCISQIVSDDIVKSMIKSKGIRQISIIDSGDSFVKLQLSLKKLNLIKAGFSIISSSMGIFSVNIEGLLIVVESGLESAISLYNYHRLAILKALSDINSYIATLKISKIERNALVQLLQHLYPNHTTSNSYSIVNFYNNTKHIIGAIDRDINITGIIIYPGNTKTPSISISTPITVSIANGTNEIYNLMVSTTLAHYYEGARYAVETSNSNNEIPGFHIELTPTDCGNYGYDVYWYTNCYSKLLKNLGIAYMTGFWYTAAYGAYVTLQQLGLTIPQISPLAQDYTVDNKTTMPYFLKQSVTQSIYFNTGFLFLESMGWDSIVVFGTDDPIYYYEYSQVIEYARIYKTQIVNPLDKSLLPWNYTRKDFEKYKSYFQAAKDTGCRVFLLTVYDRGHVLEALYDIGLRAGDFIFVSDATAMEYFTGQEDQYLLKRKELALGSFIVIYKEYVGELGLNIKKALSQKYDDISFMCMCYDTFATIKEGVNYMLNKGTDYEDPVLLSNTMRKSKFTGCLGTVYFDAQSNSRANSIFTIQQIASNKTTQNFYLFDVIYIDLFSSKLIDIVADFQWPLGGNTPSAFRDYNPCPFDNYQVINSNISKDLLYSISAFFICISIGAGIISYRSFKNDIKELTEKQIISFADISFLSYFMFQFFQFICMGPDQKSFKYVLKNIPNLISLEFFLVLDPKLEQYWKFFYIFLGFICAWIALCFIVVLRCEVTCKRIFICNWINDLTELILPVLGNIGFLPSFSVLMSIYLCDKAIGDNLQDSFLNQDCTTFCYQGDHKKYVSVVSVLIMLYLPLTIYCRHLWEKTQSCLHLKTKPIYLIILSIFQVIFVLLNKTLKVYDQSIHGYVLSGLLLLLLGITIYIRPYNYKRIDVMQSISLGLSFWGILTATIFIDNLNLYIWIIAEFVGFSVIILIGIIIMTKFPIMIYSVKGIDISTLFLFQFCKDYQRYSRDTQSLNLMNENIQNS